MSDTLPDIALIPGQWNDINALSGISIESGMLIRNKGHVVVLIVENQNQIPESFDGGWDLYPREVTHISAPSPRRIWAYCKRPCSLYVQPE